MIDSPMTNLHDVAFLIPVRIDSNSRWQNLNAIVNYLLSHFSANIYLCENDKIPKTDVAIRKVCNYIFQENNELLFPRTTINNYLIRQASAPIGILYDTDVIIPPGQLLAAIDHIRSGKVHFSLPYDGTFTEVDAYTKRLFLRNGDIGFLQAGDAYYDVNTWNSVGGCFAFRKSTYLECGLENEYIKGWGHDDAERIKRIRKLGHQLYRPDGRLYHLWHERAENSWFLDQHHEMNSYLQYLKVCAMSRPALEKEIAGWEWASIY